MSRFVGITKAQLRGRGRFLTVGQDEVSRCAESGAALTPFSRIARQRRGAANQELVCDVVRGNGLAIPAVDDIRSVLVPIHQSRRIEAIQTLAVAFAD